MKKGDHVQVDWNRMPSDWEDDGGWRTLRELCQKRHGIVISMGLGKKSGPSYVEVSFGVYPNEVGQETAEPWLLYREEIYEVDPQAPLPDFSEKFMCPVCEENEVAKPDYLCHECRFGVPLKLTNFGVPVGSCYSQDPKTGAACGYERDHKGPHSWDPF